MAGPERRFIDKVHRKLDADIHKQSMTGVAGSNGTPDYYYEGPHNALWIEYKATDGYIPLDIDLVNKKPGLSALQRRWLNRALYNNVAVAVVFGSNNNNEAILLDSGEWEEELDRCRLTIFTPEDIAEYIRGLVG